MIINDSYHFTTSSNEFAVKIDKPIKYLHQLQHEIWEAGIDFKIEL